MLAATAIPIPAPSQQPGLYGSLPQSSASQPIGSTRPSPEREKRCGTTRIWASPNSQPAPTTVSWNASQRPVWTVNPSAYAYAGSNPAPATMVRDVSGSDHAFESPRIVTVCHNSRETLRRGAQRFGLRVHISGHRERLRSVPKPRRDHGDRHVLQMHQRAARVPCVVEPNVADAAGLEHARPPGRQGVRAERRARFVDHHVAARFVEFAERQPIGCLDDLLPKKRPCRRSSRPLPRALFRRLLVTPRNYSGRAISRRVSLASWVRSVSSSRWVTSGCLTALPMAPDNIAACMSVSGPVSSPISAAYRRSRNL